MARLRSVLDQLKPSMFKTPELNQKVSDMTDGIHKLIQASSTVTNSNGSPNFVRVVDGAAHGLGEAHAVLLNMMYDSSRHRTPLPVLSYMALATLHNIGCC